MVDKVMPATDKVRLRRVHQHGYYDRDTVNAILDSGYIAHIGYLHDGAPIATPMLYWREGEFVYWHGSTASRAMKAAVGAPVCFTVTHLDGLVLAKSAFHHSANYRSVMLFGEGEAVTDPDAKTTALKFFMEQHFPGRWDTLRPVKHQELKATLIVRMQIDECAAKVRKGPPKDDLDDQQLPIWAGVLPLRHKFETAIDHDVIGSRAEIPQNVLQHIGRSL